MVSHILNSARNLITVGRFSSVDGWNRGRAHYKKGTQRCGIFRDCQPFVILHILNQWFPTCSIAFDFNAVGRLSNVDERN
jgi:hypothetical protein